MKIKKKIGSVTLVMALVFMGGWIRSRVITDWVMICSSDAMYRLESSEAGVGFVKEFDPPPLNGPPIWWGSIWQKPGLALDELPFEAYLHTSTWTIPHSMIVVPLTLLSILLLATKPGESQRSRHFI